MLITGKWQERHDGNTRPILLGEVAAFDGTLVSEDFLVDTGADVSVLSAALLERLDLPTQVLPADSQLSGIGGSSSCFLVNTTLELTKHDGGRIRVGGQFAAFIDPEATDQSILGRDILDNFDLIISRQRDEVVLLASPHQYRVEET